MAPSDERPAGPRVAIDARLVAYQRAGIGQYVLNLVEGLRSEGFGAQVLLLASRKGVPEPAFDGLATRRLYTPPHHRLEQVALALELARLDADLFHAPDFIPPLLHPVPAVITVHDLAFLRIPGLLTRESQRYYRQIGAAVRRARRIIAVSETTRRDLLDLVGADARRIDVIYEAPGHDLRAPDSDAIARARRQIGLPEAYLLFLGTREPRKNLSRLLEAYAGLAALPGIPDLVIAGRRGWLDEGLEQTASALGIGHRVRWPGGIDASLLPGLYGGAVALLVPSLYEGFGLPVLEAMACGTPVVASTGGALPEIAGGAALLVDPHDVVGWATAIRRVATDRALRDELAQRGIARAREFSWRRAARETIDVFRRAAA